MVTPPVPSRRQAPGAGEAGEVQMAKALVLGGATGLLGQALTRVLTERGWQVETLGRAAQPVSYTHLTLPTILLV